MIETGTFLIADVSGYTEYLVGSDPSHGSAIATDLIIRVVDAMSPVFEVNKLEGDAVFAYTTDPALTAAELIDVIDGVYAAFSRRLLSVAQSTACGCAACDLVPGLDLKVIAHSGSFSRQLIAGRTELVGSDVILVHRLLKNTLGFAGPGTGYMLVTDACVRRLGIDPDHENLAAHTERYPHLGEVAAWTASLTDRLGKQPNWQGATAPLYETTCLLLATAAEAWNALAPNRSDSCVTHRLSSIHEIVEWRPFERMVVEMNDPDASLIYELQLDALDEESTLAAVRWHPGRRRPQAPTWKEITIRLATFTDAALERARDRFDRPD